MRINENSPRKWQKTHSQKLFLRINENSPRKWPKTHSQKLFLRIWTLPSRLTFMNSMEFNELSTRSKYTKILVGWCFAENLQNRNKSPV